MSQTVQMFSGDLKYLLCESHRYLKHHYSPVNKLAILTGTCNVISHSNPCVYTYANILKK